MGRKFFVSLSAAALFTSANAFASTVEVAITDQSGRPAANAVVELSADKEGLASHVAGAEIIDQRHETFLPLVVVVRKGGHVTFTNNDTTMHQVYSFSPIKQFQFVIAKGEASAPVEFENAGIAAIGCNIHDQMLAFVVVSQATHAAKTDATGHVTFPDVVPGRYSVALWHPQMRSGGFSAARPVDVEGATAKIAETLPLTVSSSGTMNHMHMDY